MVVVSFVWSRRRRELWKREREREREGGGRGGGEKRKRGGEIITKIFCSQKLDFTDAGNVFSLYIDPKLTWFKFLIPQRS